MAAAARYCPPKGSESLWAWTCSQALACFPLSHLRKRKERQTGHYHLHRMQDCWAQNYDQTWLMRSRHESHKKDTGHPSGKFSRVQREVCKRKKSDGTQKVINETLSQDYVLVKPCHSILRISYLNNHPHAYFQSHGAQCSHIMAISKDAKVDRLKGTHHVWPGAMAGNPSSPQDCPPRAHL